MSWMFGVIGSTVNPQTADRCRAIHTQSLGTFHADGKYHIAAGGLSYTCLLSHRGEHENLDAFGITLGCTFARTGGELRQLSQVDWNGLRIDKKSLDGIDGHFVHFSCSNNQIEIRNDRLGLRTLYWFKAQTETIISTRLDWIARYVRGVQVDFMHLGSRWLLFNQLADDAPVAGVMRLAPAGVLRITPEGADYSYSAFTPVAREEYQPWQIAERLSRSVVPTMHNGLQPSLGLSGGLDSRVLLSLLLGRQDSKFTTHTFGAADDPDVSIAARISRDEHFSHTVFDAPIPEPSAIIALLSDYIAQTNLIEPVSTALRLRHYSGLDSSKYMMMDGGFGEIARRQYMNRLALHGKKVFRNKEVDAIFNGLRTNRADLFTSEIHDAMQAGAKAEIGGMLDSMPDLPTIGFENYLDLWAVRTRIPNFGGDEQARLDSTILNFMPFAQPSFIDDVFSMPVAQRKNGKFFRELLTRQRPSLRTYPMVKNGTTYPFALPTFAAWTLSKAKARLGYQYRENAVHCFLHLVKDYVMDMLRSRATIEYAPYEYARIERNVVGYYQGNAALSNEVNWWLTFELWRRNIEGKDQAVG